jgi:class 3 adenylate cyclase
MDASAHGTGGDELRPVTALFADVVGSTSLGERLGPDEVKALIGECVSRMSRSVEEFGGMVQAYMGDGICAYFGVPAAHEDDPERAARAGLKIIQVVGEYGRDIEAAWGISGFSVRVGINSGQTAVGLVGGATPQAVALGDTTNVAARLQSSAAPGSIAVGAVTARHLSQRFDLDSLGEVTVKGRTEPVVAWRLVGPRASPEEVSLTPLVGREEELARLQSLVDELVAGRGQILLLSGEAGIGKTRLLGELRRMASDRASWLEGACVSYGGESPAGPFVEMLRAWLGVEEGEPEVAVRTKLRARVGAALGQGADEALPFLARLLSLRLDPDQEERMRPLSSDELQAHTRAAFAEWVEALTRGRPAVVAVEDLHWASPSSRELLEDLLEVTERAPLLVAATLRPDPTSEGWRFRLRVLTDYSHRAAEQPLGPLTDEAVEQLLGVLMPLSLDEAARKTIVERAEGNPLYLEELLGALMERGEEGRQRTWTLSVSAADLPPALENLLVARIDRLPDTSRRLAQIASVIGRTFVVSLLERVAGADDVAASLPALLRAEVVREVRRYPELECTFRHGLIQEAALSTLTPANRRELYGRVAAAFEEMHADSLGEHVQKLAFYYYRSDQPSKAMDYLWRAAGDAFADHAESQGADLLRRARKVATRMGDDEAQRRIDARLAEVEAPGG